jgi:hypothetical protein
MCTGDVFVVRFKLQVKLSQDAALETQQYMWVARQHSEDLKLKNVQLRWFISHVWPNFWSILDRFNNWDILKRKRLFPPILKVLLIITEKPWYQKNSNPSFDRLTNETFGP